MNSVFVLEGRKPRSREWNEGALVTGEYAQHIADAKRGSAMLRDASLRALGIKVVTPPKIEPPKPIPPVFQERKPNRRYRKGKPRGWRKHRGTQPKIVKVQCIIGDHFRVSLYDLMGPSKSQPLTKFRQIAVYAARKVTGSAWQDIGVHFGGRDHSTLIHAFGQVEKMVAAGDEETIKALHKIHMAFGA